MVKLNPILGHTMDIMKILHQQSVKVTLSKIKYLVF